jgi:long-subunit acyl-CoA synthetase (AMP-forming)
MFSEIVQGIVTRRDDAVAAIDDQGEILTYGELIRRADALMAAIGPTRQLILLEGQNSTAWLVAYVAALRGSHPILMAPAGNVPALAQLEAAFAPTFRLTAAHGYQPEALPNAAAPLHPELALMLSTSGSTGSAKCVRLSYDNIDANAASICRYLEIGPDERGLAACRRITPTAFPS